MFDFRRTLDRSLRLCQENAQTWAHVDESEVKIYQTILQAKASIYENKCALIVVLGNPYLVGTIRYLLLQKTENSVM